MMSFRIMSLFSAIVIIAQGVYFQHDLQSTFVREMRVFDSARNLT